ncbi:MAG: restriction endonuclease subunit S [Planctomycetales bacterium]|nr:MAG: restriction endonuclease subunit S [Planctomycetales bacterium]
MKTAYVVRLGKMLQPEPSTAIDKQVPYLKALHVAWGKVRTRDLPEMWASRRDVDEWNLRPGDLLVCEGGDVGRAGFIEEAPEDCIIQNSLHRVRPKSGHSIRFLYYCLEAISASGWFDVVCNKATIRHLTAEKLAELLIPSISESVQLDIVNYLDERVAVIDVLIGQSKRSDKLEGFVGQQLNRLYEYRRALITAAVTGKIDVTAETNGSA